MQQPNLLDISLVEFSFKVRVSYLGEQSNYLHHWLAAIWIDTDRAHLKGLLGIHLGNFPLKFIHQSPASWCKRGGGERNQPMGFHSSFSQALDPILSETLSFPIPPCSLPCLLLRLYLHSVGPGSSGPRQFPTGPPEAGPANPSLSSLTRRGCSTCV